MCQWRQNGNNEDCECRSNSDCRDNEVCNHNYSCDEYNGNNGMLTGICVWDSPDRNNGEGRIQCKKKNDVGCPSNMVCCKNTGNWYVRAADPIPQKGARFVSP